MSVIGEHHRQYKAKKSLGQNFLIDKNYQQKIVAAVEATKMTEFILEIGPGQGAISQHLLKIASTYFAVEKDYELADRLKSELKKPHGAVQGDFLQIDLDFLKESSNWTAVANLPYNVASQIFIRLLENRKYFSHLFLMFQKEMALRFVAAPGTKDYGLLTIWATIYTDSKILFHLPPTVFRPQPKVTSSFVHFIIKDKALILPEEEVGFWPFVRQLFQHRRKTISSVLKDKKDKLAPELIRARAEDLSVLELIILFRRLYV